VQKEQKHQYIFFTKINILDEQTWRKKVIASTHCAFGCTVGPMTSAFCATDFASPELPGPELQRNPPNSITKFFVIIVRNINSYTVF